MTRAGLRLPSCALKMAGKTQKPIALKDIRGKNSIDREITQGGRNRICQVVEAFIAIALIVLVWGLFALPILFYNLKTETPAPIASNDSANASGCINTILYDSSDRTCQFELLDILTASNCHSGAGQSIFVQRDGLELVNQIFQGLEFIGASETCVTEAKSFMCLYAYGLCSSSGENIQPTSGQCEELRDTLCQSEWAVAISFGIYLPNCYEFPKSPTYCHEQLSSNITESAENNSRENNRSLPDDTLLECSESFYRENGSQVCVPSCYSWTQYGRKLSIGIDVVVIFMAIIGGSAAVSILIISCLKPKRMCKFPAIFVVYMVVDILILEFFVMVSRMDRKRLHCSSRNLLESLQEVTPFCIITGLFFSYILLQLAVWWFSHTAILFWKVFFPFHSQTFKASGRLKYVHIVCVTIGVLFPLVTIVTSMIEFGVESSNKADNSTSATELFLSGGLGYSATTFPPILCTASDEDAGFYSLILPIGVVQAIVSSMLILSLWHIHRQSANKKLDSPYLFHLGTAEKKLLVVFFYVEIMLIVVLTTFTLNTRYDREFIRSLFEFFSCEQRGHDPDSPCSQSDINRFGFPSATIVSYIIFGLFPVVILVYAINVREMKKVLHSKRKTYKLSQTSK